MNMRARGAGMVGATARLSGSGAACPSAIRRESVASREILEPVVAGLLLQERLFVGCRG